MKTWTGSEAPLEIGTGTVNILDLVVHSGRELRWGGFGATDWTVLHHTALVTFIWMKAGFPAAGLPYIFLHDMHESYTGDIPSPVKRHLGGGIKELERRLDHRIRKELDLPAPDDETIHRVKLCDYAALSIEAPLFGPPGASEGETATRMVVDPNPEVVQFREEVDALVKKVLPDFELILHRRASVGNR